ncbi:MAG TPA: hypothetical protein VN258_06200 [Mobilitalea sp.]|nr:hypothetical protein [Mobilitalea sp.]
MKIAFWSNNNEKCAVSANLAAISVASVIRYPYSVITMENHMCSNNLGKAFTGRTANNLMNEVGTNYYDGGAMEGLMRKIYRGGYCKGMIRSYIKEIISKHLYYIPQSRVIHSEIFDYEFSHCIYQLLDMTEEVADICFIDTASHQNLSTKTILEEADLIVVNLCQSQKILEDFFLNYSSLITKAIFIISNYNTHTKLHMKKISNTYDIPIENIAIIPKNEAFLEAFNCGNVVEFITGNYSCPKDNVNYIFMQAIKKTTYMIIKKAVEITKKKEILCSR